MQLPALQVQQFDLARADKDAASVSGMRLQNRLTRGAIDKNAMISGLRGQLFSPGDSGGDLGALTRDPMGMDSTDLDVPSYSVDQSNAGQLNPKSKVDQDILQQLMAADPVGTKQLIDGLDKMSARELRQTREKNSMGGGMMLRLMDLPDEQRPMAYQQMLAAAEKQGIQTKNLPRQYNEQALMNQLQRSVSLDKLAELIRKSKLQKDNMVEVAGPDGSRTLRSVKEGMSLGKEKTEAQSKTGKRVADRQMFLDQYGEGSPQVKAFDEMATLDDRGAPKLTDIGGLRKEFTKLSGDYIKVRDAYARIGASAKDPSAAGDLALIFNYMKVLDPGSTVREGEFATAQNSAGVPDRVRNVFNKIMRGERLGVDQRKDFVDRAEKLYNAQLSEQNKLTEQFSGIARRQKMDPRNVVVDFIGSKTPKETPKEGPEVTLASKKITIIQSIDAAKTPDDLPKNISDLTPEERAALGKKLKELGY